MIEFRKQIKELVTYILNPEERDEDVIENYTDTVMLACEEYHIKQLLLHDVVKSLPSKEELNIELSNKLIDIFDDDENWEKEHYKYGFNACFAFIKEYLMK